MQQPATCPPGWKSLSPNRVTQAPKIYAKLIFVTPA